MSNLPPLRLSEMPDFLPAGEPGSPERRACALGTFTDEQANLEVMRSIAKRACENGISVTAFLAPPELARRRVAHQHANPTPDDALRREMYAT